MIFDGIDILSSLKTKLAWLNDRQAILSRNIANASTPGYVPQDLTQPNFSAALAEASRGGFFSTTNARHMRGRPLADGRRGDQIARPFCQIDLQENDHRRG